MMYVLLRGIAFASDPTQLFAVGGSTSGSGGGSSSQLSSVETLASASGTWITEGNGLNVARSRCVGASRPRAIGDEWMLVGAQR